MRLYEAAYLLGEAFLPVLHGKVRREVKHLLKKTPARPARLLDVGGRKSPYTIGLPVSITVLDVPRENKIQERLHLGLTDSTLAELRSRRSNICEIVIQDMTKCTLPSASFDGVVCVEVIEHVRDVEALVGQIARVLRPGGWVYLTTPNGDYIRNEQPNYNPDHVRHYTRKELVTLLSGHFEDVKVNYGIKTGKYRLWGLKTVSFRRPERLLIGMLGNIINRIESRHLEDQSRRTAHLFGVAKRKVAV